MAAPKGNVFALGNNGGRPRIYDDPEKLEQTISQYFEHCVNEKENITITGLCLYLGFSSRDTLHSYKKRDEFSDIIKRAIMVVENAYEHRLYTFAFGGAIFALKNINKDEWKDKTEQEVNQTITNVEATFGSTIQTAHQPSADS